MHSGDVAAQAQSSIKADLLLEPTIAHDPYMAVAQKILPNVLIGDTSLGQLSDIAPLKQLDDPLTPSYGWNGFRALATEIANAGRGVTRLGTEVFLRDPLRQVRAPKFVLDEGTSVAARRERVEDGIAGLLEQFHDVRHRYGSSAHLVVLTGPTAEQGTRTMWVYGLLKSKVLTQRTRALFEALADVDEGYMTTSDLAKRLGPTVSPAKVRNDVSAALKEFRFDSVLRAAIVTHRGTPQREGGYSLAQSAHDKVLGLLAND